MAPRRRSPPSSWTRASPGFEVRMGPNSVSHRGFHHCELIFTDCRIHERQILGEEHRGLRRRQRMARRHAPHRGRSMHRPGPARARTGDGMGRHPQAVRPDHRKVPGCRLQARRHGNRDRRRRAPGAITPPGSSIKAVRHDQDFAMAKLFATETLARVTDHAVQIFGGMGLMEELPVERLWRDAQGRAHLGRHLGNPAPYHFAQPAAPARRLIPCSPCPRRPVLHR